MSLQDRAHERVETFSGGMRRRVELAKGLLNRPEILLLDEPSTGLDPGARIDLWQTLRDIQSTGVTILLTTHLMDEADRCSRLAILTTGKLVANDTPTALKERIGGDVITITSPDPLKLKDLLEQRLNLPPDLLKSSHFPPDAGSEVPRRPGSRVTIPPENAPSSPPDNTLRLERPRGHEFIPQIIEAAPGLVDSISLGKPTLEDVFIHLTGKRFQ